MNIGSKAILYWFHDKRYSIANCFSKEFILEVLALF